MQRTAFVTGGTGFLGGHVIRALLRRGFHVRALVRSNISEPGVELVRGDLTADADLSPALAGCDVVFHCAGIVGDRITWESGRAVNVGGTRRILAAAKTAGVRRVVHVSSVAVYGFDAGTFAEDAPRRTVGEPYIDTKTEAELACEQLDVETTSVCIVRPGVIYGPNDGGMIPRMIELFRERRVPMIGDGSAQVGLVHVNDVVDAMLACAESAAAHGAFNVIGPDDLTWAELIEWMVDRFGVPAPRRLPAALAMTLAGIMEGLAAVRLAPRPPPLNSQIVKFLTAKRTYPTQRLADELGIVPRIYASEGLRATWGVRAVERAEGLVATST